MAPYAVFLVLCAVSWNRWIEPYVDSGRELAVPWRISEGQRLYRDVRFFHGPLGPYLAAGVDAVVGRSLDARILLSGLIALLHIEALRRLASRFLPRDEAALTIGVIVAATFFLRPGGCHLFPFSLDTSLATAAIAGMLGLAGSRSRRGDLAASGCLAVALLSRPEMGLVAAAALAFEVGVSRRIVRLEIPGLAVAALAYGAVSAGVPWKALRSEGWLAILGPPTAFRNIYASYAGLDRPGLRLAELALAAIAAVLAGCLLAGTAAAARARQATGRDPSPVEYAGMALLAAAVAIVLRPPEALREPLSLLPPLLRIVPAVTVGAAVAGVLRRLRGRTAPAGLSPALLVTSGFFALRVLLAAGYGGPYNAFQLPLPLLVCTVLLFASVRSLARAIGPALPRLVAGSLLIFVGARGIELADVFRGPAWRRVDTPVGSLFLAEPVAGTTALALSDLSARLPPGATLVGLPEGGFFNYTLGRRNPLPDEQFFPGHLDAEAEAETIRELAARPPDAIVYCNVLAVGHRSVVLGKDYLSDLDRFVRSRYVPAASFGPGAGPAPRVGDPQFFVEVRVPAPVIASR